jgi:hypothetical protein
MCSAGRGVMTKNGCLACSAQLANECGFDYSLLNALYSDKERTGIHVTDLTGCLRQSYYSKTEAPLEFPHQMLARFYGTAVHAHIESFPMPEFFDSELSVDALGLVGTADIVYKNGRLVDFKCQPAGELVTMADGTEKPINEIRIFDQVLSLYDGEFGSDTVTGIVDGGVQEVFEIRIASGQTFRASGNHPVLTERGWVDAKDLREKEDRVIALSNWLACKTVLPEDDARLIGYLTGDGGTSRQYGIRFTNADPEVISDIRNICMNKGWDLAKVQQGDPDNYDYRIGMPGRKLSTTGPMTFIQQFGLHRKLAHEKTVPSTIMSGDLGTVTNFLAGYFDTDGTITNPETVDRIPCRLSMMTVSKELARQVSELLRRLGIVNRIHTHSVGYGGRITRTGYAICVWQADMVLKFGKLIPFRCAQKRDRWQRWVPYLEQKLRKGGKQLHRVESVTSLGELRTIGLEIMNTHNYITSGVVTHNTTRWLMKNKLPYGSHVRQLNVYAALLRAQGREVTSAAIQYIDLSGPTKCSSCKGPCEPDEGGVMVCTRCGKTLPNGHPGVAMVEVELEDDAIVAEWINTRRKLLEMALESNTSPDPDPSYLCDYCAFASRCAKEI